MDKNIMLYLGVYLAVMNLAAIILTVKDKIAARRRSRRVKERTLLWVSVLGGSLAMFITMRLVRHKTKRAKFMAGLPIIITLQIAAALFIWWWVNGF
jgi:uncharacterized membrane protein YsdA (DUF1294 family)